MKGDKVRERDREDEKNYRSSCLHVPLVLSTREHSKQGLILVLSRIIPVSYACVILSFYPHASMMNGVFFSFYLEEFPFVVLVCTSLSLHA